LYQPNILKNIPIFNYQQSQAPPRQSQDLSKEALYLLQKKKQDLEEQERLL
jgi:hypothetical protein